MIHEFPELGYEYDVLEPHIDTKTMEIHYSKHHRAYFDKFLKSIEQSPELQEKPIEEILSNVGSIPKEIKNAVINNGGGFCNHSFFWKILKKDSPFKETLGVGKAIIQKFGSFEKFKEEFTNAAVTVFGSGWAWLVLDNSTKQLEIIQTKNQESPLSLNKKPLMGVDVWEHAYYLKYQNQRPAYLEAFFNVINWEKVEELFEERGE